MIFIQEQILLLLALLSGSGEQILAIMKTSNLFCSRGLRPLDPQQGTAPVPRWGPGWFTGSLRGRGPLSSSAGYFFLFSCYLKTWQPKNVGFFLGSLQCRRFLWARNLLAKAPCWNFPKRESKMAATTILQTWTRFCPPKIRLHCRLFFRLLFIMRFL